MCLSLGESWGPRPPLGPKLTPYARALRSARYTACPLGEQSQGRRGVGARSCAQLRAPTPRRRRLGGVGVRNCEPGGLRGVVRGKYNVLRAGADPGRLYC